jgi:hypothetical protein
MYALYFYLAKSFFMNAIYMTHRSKRHTLRKKGGKHTSRNRRRQRRSLKKGGGCGCDNNNKSFFSGGSNQLGPSPGLDQLPIRSYYDLNTYDNDPNDPSNVMSVRTQPNMVSGGRRRRHKSRSKTTGRSRRGGSASVIKGGGLLDSWSLIGSDPISNFGTAPGSFNSNELLRGNFGANPNPSIQPVTQMFNANNGQLV